MFVCHLSELFSCLSVYFFLCVFLFFFYIFVSYLLLRFALVASLDVEELKRGGAGSNWNMTNSAYLLLNGEGRRDTVR